MRIVFACLFAACAQPAPPPVKPPQQVAVRTPVTDVPTCADMGPLLRGDMEEDEDTEGPKKEALIIASCERDKWPAPVIACVASATEPTVHECLRELSEESLVSYTKAIAEYGLPPVAHDLPIETSCEDAIAGTSVDAWPPAVTTDDRALAVKLRGQPLEKLCEDQRWTPASRKCIGDSPASGVDACLEGLGAARADVDRVIKEADELRAKIMKAQAKPADVTCAKVVAVHYGPAKWKGKAPELEGKARTKAIQASKKALLEFCNGSWTIEARACVVATDSDACTALGALGVAWGYPATLNSPHVAPTGITSCDEYGAAVVALSNCPSVPKPTRDALVDAFMQASSAWKNLPPEAISAVETACAAARDATRQVLADCS